MVNHTAAVPGRQRQEGADAHTVPVLGRVVAAAAVEVAKVVVAGAVVIGLTVVCSTGRLFEVTHVHTAQPCASDVVTLTEPGLQRQGS